MDTQTHHDFTRIVQQAQALFTDIRYVSDATPERAILRLQAKYGSYRVFVTELRDAQTRKYRYYLLKDAWVMAGFDNSPDPRALRLKYGRIGQHAGELVPHLHRENKQHLELTDEITMEEFIQWVRGHFPLEGT
ncbi:MAG: hypothetical protein GY801_49935 [bacterium]|nr:hypothetical protein [bacterium]